MQRQEEILIGGRKRRPCRFWPLWLLCLFGFGSVYPHYSATRIPSAGSGKFDAIFVLAGGEKRIATGLDAFLAPGQRVGDVELVALELRAGMPLDLAQARHGATVQIAGNVICRQRPGTAKGFVFISLEDESGVSNAIVEPDLFARFRLVITEEAFLLIEGEAQNSESVVLIKARDIKPLAHQQLNTASPSWGGLIGSESHDFR